MELKTQCNSCKNEFALNAENVKEKTVTISEDSQEVMLTYYNCPECGKLFVVQIDTQETKNMLIDIKKLMRTAMVKQCKNQQIKKKEMNKYNLLNKGIDDIRMSLAIRYNHEHYIENGEEVELTMSMLDGGGKDENDSM